MSLTITQVKENLSAMLHGGTLNRVRNIEALFERAGNNVLSKIDPLETLRTQPLTNTVYTDVYNYSLPADFKTLVDLYPQANRQSLDSAVRQYAERFDLRKGFNRDTVSIEANEGTKVIRINWSGRGNKVLHNMDSVTNNGTWDASGGTTGIEADTITKRSGSASIRFDQAASGDGINNDDMSAVDMTDEDETADVFFSVYLKDAADVSAFTSVTVLWGNDLTANYWTGVAQTAQADGTAVQLGWNLFKVPWSTATETGTVDPSAIDSFRLTIAGSSAISDVRVDRIFFSIGRAFDIKYNSKYFIQNSSGTWLARTTSDDDTVVFDTDSMNIFLYECLIEAAQQVEGFDSNFDMDYARKMLNGDPNSPDPMGRRGLYAEYRSEHPTQSKRSTTAYGTKPRATRRRRSYYGS